MLEELRIGIVADIATVTAMTKTAVLNAQTNTAAGTNLPVGTDAPFGVLLQQLAQPAAPANDTGLLAETNDTTNAQVDSISQTEQQAFQQTPQDALNLISLLQSVAPQQSQTATSQSGGTALVTDPSSETALDAMVDDTTAALVPAAQSTTRDVPQKSVKPPAKNDQTKAADADSDAESEPKTAPDAALIAVLMQQTQAVAIQPQVAQIQASAAQPSDDAAVAATVAAAGAAPVAADGNPMPVRPQMSFGKVAAAISGKTESGDAKQTGTDDSGAPASDTPNVVAPKADAKGNDALGPDRPTNTHQQAASAQPAQSSAPGQSPNTSVPSVTATSFQAQIQSANAASVNVNLQVAPQHRDTASTSTMDTLGVAIAAKSADGIKHFDIRLDPPELGRVQVHLSLDDSGKAQASLVVDKPQTLELLQRDAAGLTRSLNDAGVSLSNNGLNFSLRGQDRQSDGGSVVKGRSRELSVKAVVGTDAISNSNYVASLAPDSVRLDIRV